MAIGNMFSGYFPRKSQDKMAMQAQEKVSGAQSMLEILAAFAKPKMIWMAVTNTTLLTIGFLAIAALMIVRGANLAFSVQTDEPTIPEMERHLESHDQRLDKVVDLINQKFDKLEEDRQARKKDSDARYEALQHDVTYLYGGIAAICGGLALGVFKLFAESGHKDAGLRLSSEDTQQLAYLLAEMRNSRNVRNRRD